jgi:hypothetical protein
MDGVKTDLQTTFYDKGDSMTITNDKGNDQTLNLSYEDIESPPLHNNCRCVLIPITE